MNLWVEKNDDLNRSGENRFQHSTAPVHWRVCKLSYMNVTRIASIYNYLVMNSRRNTLYTEEYKYWLKRFQIWTRFNLKFSTSFINFTFCFTDVFVEATTTTNNVNPTHFMSLQQVGAIYCFLRSIKFFLRVYKILRPWIHIWRREKEGANEFWYYATSNQKWLL